MVVFMNTTTTTYSVPEKNIAKLRVTLDKLVKKAAKLSVGAVSYAVGEFKDVVSNETDAFGNAFERWTRYYAVAVTGERPVLSGWEFVATLQHAGEAGNVLRCIPGVELPKEFRNAAPACSHCKVQRRRIDTFVVRNEAGEHKQIGRNCVQDFVGGKDPQEVAKLAEYLQLAADACGESEGAIGGREVVRFGNLVFMAQAAAVIRTLGFISRTKAREAYEPMQATSDTVFELLEPSREQRQTRQWQELSKLCEVTEADIKVANETIDWVAAKRGDETLNDYFFNLTVVLGGESIDVRGMGLAASAVSVYLREIGRQAEAAIRAKAQANSVHVGEVGKRSDFDVTVTGVISKDGQWGTTHITKMLTKEGNVLTWFASSGSPLEVGQSFRITGTVKDHGEFQGVKQTIVSRCTVWTEEGIKEAEEKKAKKAAREAKKAEKAAKLQPNA